MSNGVPHKVMIAGVGLLGGSIAAALRKRSPETRIHGIGRSQDRLKLAQEAGLLDSHAPQAGGFDPDLIVVCTPVDRIVHDVRAAAATTRGAVITDVGSVKAPIVSELNDLQSDCHFVGSHPMAGSEKTGFEHARADLFEGAHCIVCPTESTDPTALQKTCDFWTHLGGQVSRIAAADHDRIVAAISHLPHIVAAALARVPSDDAMRFAATGFRDTTRVAGGDPELWTAILRDNRDAVIDELNRMERQLSELRAAMSEGEEAVREYLAAARDARGRLQA